MWRFFLAPWLAMGTQQRDRGRRDRDTGRTRDRQPADCPACGEQMDPGTIPTIKGYRQRHCGRCRRGIERRAWGRVSNDRESP